MLRTLVCFCLCVNLVFPLARFVDAEPLCAYSSLWGTSGEKFKAAGRLPDFSYAGYHAGEATIPTPKAEWDLKRDFHAKGDGQTDDTLALRKAIESIKRGVLFIPEGVYVISQSIDISKGDFVIRGAGSNKSILLFPNSLTDLFGNRPNAAQQSEWSFRPGLINVTGADPINAKTRIATVTAPAKRGGKTLQVSNKISIAPGEWIRLTESDPAKVSPSAGSLIHYLYGDLMPPGSDLIGASHAVRFLSRVKAMTGNTIELERPLPYDVRTEWSPEIHRFVPTVHEFGIEHLSVHFPWTAYPGHFREKGYNGVFFLNLSQSWINDVEIQNADFGVDLGSTNFCTVKNVTLTTSASRAVGADARGNNGHHGIDVNHGTENLVTNFEVLTKFVHDISVEWYALHTVFANGRGIDLNMDHHREANYSTLFSNLDCGAGTRPFNSGGSANRGAHSGAYSTYWNIYARAPMLLPPADFGPLLNFVGVELVDAGKDPNSPYQWVIERTGPAGICPSELHEAMRTRRLRL